MNHIINNILLFGSKLIPEMHFRQLEFTYSAHGTFIEKKNAYKNLKRQGMKDIFIHETIMQTGILCKKILCSMRDSDCGNLF